MSPTRVTLPRTGMLFVSIFETIVQKNSIFLFFFIFNILRDSKPYGDLFMAVISVFAFLFASFFTTAFAEQIPIATTHFACQTLTFNRCSETFKTTWLILKIRNDQDTQNLGEMHCPEKHMNCSTEYSVYKSKQLDALACANAENAFRQLSRQGDDYFEVEIANPYPSFEKLTFEGVNNVTFERLHKETEATSLIEREIHRSQRTCL